MAVKYNEELLAELLSCGALTRLENMDAVLFRGVSGILSASPDLAWEVFCALERAFGLEPAAQPTTLVDTRQPS